MSEELMSSRLMRQAEKRMEESLPAYGAPSEEAASDEVIPLLIDAAVICWKSEYSDFVAEYERRLSGGGRKAVAESLQRAREASGAVGSPE